MNHPIFVVVVVLLVADDVVYEYRKRINLLIAPVFQVTSIVEGRSFAFFSSLKFLFLNEN